MNPFDELLAAIHESGGHDSDEFLRKKLGWDKLYYLQVRKQLVADGRIYPDPNISGRVFVSHEPTRSGKNPKKNSPLTFEIKEDLASQIEEFKTSSGSSSVSAIIRAALEEYDFDDFRPEPPKTRQLSIRLPDPLKKKLQDTASLNGSSLGMVVREAIIAFLNSENLAERGPISNKPRKLKDPIFGFSGQDEIEDNPWQI